MKDDEVALTPDTRKDTMDAEVDLPHMSINRNRFRQISTRVRRLTMWKYAGMCPWVIHIYSRLWTYRGVYGGKWSLEGRM